MQDNKNGLHEFRKHPVIRQLFLLIRKGEWNNRKQKDRLTSLEGQMIRQLEELQLLRKEFKTTVRIGLIIMLSALSGISAPDSLIQRIAVSMIKVVASLQTLI
jgi:hypothetical protein